MTQGDLVIWERPGRAGTTEVGAVLAASHGDYVSIRLKNKRGEVSLRRVKAKYIRQMAEEIPAPESCLIPRAFDS